LIVLGIETSSPVCSVCLLEDDHLLAEYTLNIRNAHAKVLAGAITKILHDTSKDMNDVGGLAISIGPGSFTGLRIGLSMAKGLALETQIQCAAVFTMEALAFQAPIQSGLIGPFIKSRANEYMAAIYERENYSDKNIKDVTILKSEKLFDFFPNNTIIIGRHIDLDKELLPKSLIIAPDRFSNLSGSTIAKLGARKILSGDTVDIDTIEPSYYQDFIAGKPKKLLDLG
jgi:tRNA threonylcarbamoyladenosine biosynthesis protein TsaB